MKKKDLLDLAIKIVGIILFVYSINSIKELLLYTSLPIMDSIGVQRTTIISILVFTVIVQWAAAFLLLLRSKTLTGVFLKSDIYEAETTLPTSPQRSHLKLGLIFIGVTVTLLTLPEFIVALVKYVTLVQENSPNMTFDSTAVIISGLKISLSVVLIYFADQISGFVYQKKEG